MDEGSFKSLAEVTVPDARNLAWVVLDRAAPGGTRPITLGDDYEEMASLILPDSVPENVRHHFDAVRMLWIYGWFYYPFYTWAGFHSALCAESALLQRLGHAERRDKRTPFLRSLLAEAVRKGLLKDEGFGHARRAAAIRKDMEDSFPDLKTLDEQAGKKAWSYVEHLVKSFPRLRDMHAHPRSYFYVLPGSGRSLVEVTRDLIAQLWDEDWRRGDTTERAVP